MAKRQLRRLSTECTGTCPRCGERNAYPYTYTGSHGYLDVCMPCVREAHDELLAELEEADADFTDPSSTEPSLSGEGTGTEPAADRS